MRIDISYDSCWRNSFLAGSNNEPLPAKGRKFIGSMTELKKEGNFKSQAITNDTVMGVLNRLIGDQRKLYQSREDEKYFFKDIDTGVELFMDSPQITNEITFIRNVTGSEDQNSFTGAIKANHAAFNSDYSDEFWGVLALDFEALCKFIVSNEKVSSAIKTDPIAIIIKLEILNKAKTVLNEGMASKAVEELQKSFEGIEYLNKKGEVVPVSLYCSSLYLQLERLSKRFNMDSAKTKTGGIQGVSKRGFTKKDFMVRFTTGPKKRIWGNPYILKQRIKGTGEVTSLMTKASGTLEININVDRCKAQEIKKLIENAGVSSFYLGKKGLAYVTHIDTREVE